MRECKHESVTGYMWRPRMIGRGQIMEWSYAFAQPGNADHHHRLVCDDCGAWLPIGPAAPHTEQTRIELRAAELSDLAHSHATPAESAGWIVYRSRDGARYPSDENHAEWQVGYLAACIATPDKEQP